MKTPLLSRSHAPSKVRPRERGVTMVLVALAMIAIIGMAALSIDVVTLYLAREESQRAADSAALAAARIISVSGITGDPNNLTGNWLAVCGPDDGTNGIATRVAKSVAAQNTIGGIAAPTITVTYSAGSGGAISGSSDCTTLATSAFGVNPMVTVQLSRTGLATFFSRIWGNPGNSVSATATAEAFNSSNSGNVGNQTSGTITPVQPRCVKPWAVPNLDPMYPAGPNSKGYYCGQGGVNGPGPCTPLVSATDGSISHPGISLNGSSANGVIGETFWLDAGCHHDTNSYCRLRTNSPQANYPQPTPGDPYVPAPPNLLYVPGQVGMTIPIAVPSCTTGDPYNQAIVGCDQETNYTCGLPPSSGGTNVVDTSVSPNDSTAAAAQCLIGQTDTTNLTASSGQDYFNTTTFGQPNAYPFQVLAGSGNPLVTTGLAAGSTLSASASIVSLPIYDNTTAPTIGARTTTAVAFVGFLQVFINAFDPNGNLNVTVLNVTGCSNGSSGNVGANSVIGTSPVPVRLITPP
jgi:Flp pilus assembly protein TadG